MKTSLRAILLGTALVGTAGAAIFAPDGDTAVDSPVERPHDASRWASAATGSEPAHAVSLPARRIRTEDDDAALLAAFVTPPAAPAPPPPPPPRVLAEAASAAPPPSVPPPVPFTVVGRYADGSVQKAFVVSGQAHMVVGVGDLIGQDYVVTAISPNQLTLTYRPLDMAQVVPIVMPRP